MVVKSFKAITASGGQGDGTVYDTGTETENDSAGDTAPGAAAVSGTANTGEAVAAEETAHTAETAAEGNAASSPADNSAGADLQMDNGDAALPEDSDAVEEELREPLEKYTDILKINPYVAGWLEIEGSKLNAPVVYTPKSQNYFIHRGLDGSDNNGGTLFIAVIWREGYNNTLIYGHNMKDGTLFGSLTKYKDKAYGESHSRIKFDTLYEEREYELLGAFYTSIEEEELETDEDRASRDREVEKEAIEKIEEEAKEEKPAKEGAEGEEPSEETRPSEETKPEAPPVLTLADMHLDTDLGDIDVYRTEKDSDMQNGKFRYYYYTDLTYKEDYDYFIENVKNSFLYDTGVDAQWGEELLTLSTCSYQKKNGRFIVVAKRVR